jgi:hypothetical protein
LISGTSVSEIAQPRPTHDRQIPGQHQERRVQPGQNRQRQSPQGSGAPKRMAGARRSSQSRRDLVSINVLTCPMEGNHDRSTMPSEHVEPACCRRRGLTGRYA